MGYAVANPFYNLIYLRNAVLVLRLFENMTITLNNIDLLVLEKLQILVTQNNRTLSDEIKAILEQVMMAESSKNSPIIKHNPLRGTPIIISSDFDEPMPKLWDALAE
jgi:hypothetical protein